MSLSAVGERDPRQKSTTLLDEYSREQQVWASTSAVLWTAERPQERGIHVHAYEINEYLIDDTFGIVRSHDRVIERSDLFQTMTANTIS